MNGKLWYEQDIETLRRMYPSRPTREITEILERGIDSIYHMAQKLGLEKSQDFRDSDASGRLRKGHALAGERTWFPKGHVPANKGSRRPGWSAGRMKDTQFKKGSRGGIAAKNWVPIGTILPDTGGYLRIKVREAMHGKEPTGYGNTKVWPFYSRYIWEQQHGPVPPKHLVVFKDNDHSNCSIENLELISMAENARRNTMWGRFPRPLAEAIQLNGALKRKLRNMHGKEQDNGPSGSPLRNARSA